MKLRPLALVLEGGVCGLALAYGARKSPKTGTSQVVLRHTFLVCVLCWALAQCY